MTISIVMPFWNRTAALDHSMRLMDRHYGALDLELVVVDDGSAEPPLGRPDVLVSLPPKTVALNPCVPINRGVAASCGDVLVLTNPEILHVVPVLSGMLAELERLGPRGYVMAATWAPEGGVWHCHSQHPSSGWPAEVPMPKGAGFHFCAMLRRSLWDAAGGFDEDYRDGAGYDDPDWCMRLARAGAVFRIRDDLIVHHPREGCRARWPAGAFERNRRVFLGKWATPAVAT